MIFVTAGHKEFDRLIKQMDSISINIETEIIMQIGYKPSYLPKNTEYFNFIQRNEIDGYFQRAELIISHCSVGVLLRAQKHLKPLIMVPRQHILKEHVDDHQVGFARMLIEHNNVEGIELVFDINDLQDIIERVMQDKKPVALKSFGQKKNLIETLQNFVSNVKKNKKC